MASLAVFTRFVIYYCVWQISIAKCVMPRHHIAMRYYFLCCLWSLCWVFAQPTAWAKSATEPRCDHQFTDATMPRVAAERAYQLITPLCLQGFSVGYSHQLRTPIWSAAYLTRPRLRGAYALKRSNLFHEETALPSSSRVRMNEMRMHGYDRGHLSPNYDMGTAEQQYDSFSLANIALQHRWHNRNLWSDIEKLTRHQVYQYGDAYVVTGVAFLAGKDIARSGLAIPSHFFKAVYVPELGQAGVYWSKNDGSGHLNVISLADLAKKTQLSVMPSLPAHVQQNALHLPTDVSDPEATVNVTQQVEAVRSFWSRLGGFFAELWAMVVGLFV